MAGRKPKHDFTDRDLIMTIEGMVRDGADNKQIAKYLGYTETYFCEAQRLYPELGEAIRRGRKPWTTAIENSLIKRCTGMKVKSTTRRWMVGPDGKQTDVEIVQETETEVPPEPKSIMFYLTQRKPEVYNKQPQKVDLTTGGNPFMELMQKASTSEAQVDAESRNNTEGD